MRISRLCGFFLLLILASTLAFADGIQDPKVIIKGAGGNIPDKGRCEQCQAVGFKFSFTIPESGSGDLFFTNASGANWSSLALFVTGVPAADISCHSPFFASCTTKTLKNGEVEILFSNNSKSNWRDHGIVNGQNFDISFSCVKGTCWPGGITVTGHGSPGTLPEPATLALMATGLGAIFTRRKAWKNRFNS
jgi:hypothetical protein